MSYTAIRNSDGEYIGLDHHYGDEGDYSDEDYFRADYDAADGPHEGCCARGDWNGHKHQPDSAVMFVPVVVKNWPMHGERVYFDETPTADYLWECSYCGRVGTAADLNS